MKYLTMTNLVNNRKALHDYAIIDTIEAGIILMGGEVKCVIDHKASLDGAYAYVENGELWLINSHIDEYKNNNAFQTYSPTRKRKLLLNKQEIRKFAEEAKQKGFTLIPLSFYFNNGKIKVKLALAKGKQAHDKRETLKKRDAEKEMRRR